MKAGAKIAAVAAIWMSANLFAGDSRYGLPFATSLPSVDGVMSEREWDEGVTVAGFFAPSAKGRLSAGGDGYATFLTDGSRLFAAWRVRARNVDVDGGLKAAAKNRDGAVYDDDGVELVVQAGTAGKIAHFIFNSIGTAYDSLSSKEDGTDVKWNCAGLKVATSVNGGWWTTEASLPISEIGEAADGLFVNAACTFSGRGSASLNASPSHVFGPKLRLCPMRGAAAVRLYDIGNPRYGYWAPKLSVSCGDPSREFSCEISLREEGAPADAAPAMLKRGTFRSGGRISGKFETRLRKPFVLKALVTDAATGETVYERSVAALRESTDRIPPTASFDLGESEATVFHYPGLGKMRVTVSQTPGMPIKGAACSIAGVEYALDAGKDCFTGLVDVPKGDGEYPLDFALDGAGGRLRFNKAWTLVRRREPWEGKGIGLGRVIVPPFRPITASGGNAIEVILRKYAFGDAGLPSSVRALGREILAGPSFFEGVVDGRRVRFAGGAPSISIAGDGYDAAVNAEASAAGVSLKVRSTVEQDGFVWNEVALSGKPAHTIERLTFVMPLKDSEAPLMHACAVDRIRANPAGRVPAGEGEVDRKSVV